MNHSLDPPNPYLFPPTTARLATPDDIALLAENLRQECAQELTAATGLIPLEVLSADPARTYLMESRLGVPLAALLVSPYPGTTRHGIMQIFVSNAVTRHRHGRDVTQKTIDAVLTLHRTGHDEVHSLVDARNVNVAALLMNCGFAFQERYDSFGAEGRPFGHYVSRIKAVAGKLN